MPLKSLLRFAAAIAVVVVLSHLFISTSIRLQHHFGGIAETPSHDLVQNMMLHRKLQEPAPGDSWSFTSPLRHILMGIMTMDAPNELEYRQQFRQLFGIFAAHRDARVCSLGDYLDRPESHYGCQLVYTFVLGGNPIGATELVNNSVPLLTDASAIVSSDRLFNDLTLLNIRENMEEGKSQTWMYRAQQLMKEHRFDYVAKCDTDSVLDMQKFFEFANEYLPPAPYNKGIIAGKPSDKLWWGNWRQSPLDYPEVKQEAKEGFLRERYRYLPRRDTIFHIYAIGQFYLLSPDLVDTVVQEASSQRHKAYMEGAEDHDISTMAFHSTRPIHFIFLSQTDMQFWEHGVKLTIPDRPGLRRYWRRTWSQAKQKLDAALSESQRASMEHALLVGK